MKKQTPELKELVQFSSIGIILPTCGTWTKFLVAARNILTIVQDGKFLKLEIAKTFVNLLR